MKILKFKLLIVLLLLVTMPILAHAQLIKCGGNDQGPCQLGDLVVTIMKIINFLLAWAGLVAIFFIVWGAWQMINAGGNSEEVTRGKDTFKHAVIGFFLVMAMFLLLNFVVGALTGQPRIDVLKDLIENIPK